jgi:Flagellar biosynthesis protein, FliO
VRGDRRATPRLALVERITLAPRQSLALVEAEGRRILVATSADGASAFYPLDEIGGRPERTGQTAASAPGREFSARVSNAISSRRSW